MKSSSWGLRLLLLGCFAVFFSLALLSHYQRVRVREYQACLRELRDVRVDLAEGLNFYDLSRSPNSPFDASLGKARVLQAIAVLQQLDLAHPAEADRLRAGLEQSGMMENRLDLFRIDQRVRARERLIRSQYLELSERQEMLFHWVLFGCMFLVSGASVFLLKAREAARLSERRFRQMAESVHEVFWVYDRDRAGFEYVSPRAVEIVGWGAEELLANPKLFRESVYPADQPLLDRLDRTRSQGPKDEVYRVRGPAGEVRWIRDRSFPVGRKLLVGAVEDVTQSRRTHRWLESLLEQSRDLIFTVDREGQSNFASPACCRAFGPTFNLVERAHSDDRQALLERLRKQEDLHFSLDLETLAGEVLPLEIVGAWIADEDPPLAILVGRDVRERRHLQEQLISSQKLEAVGRLAGGIAHDFNNMLTIIQGNVMLYPEGEATQELQSEVLSACDTAARLVRQLLLFSRGQPARKVRIDLGLVLRELAPLLQAALGKQHQLLLNLGPTAEMKADRSMLEQLVFNLIVNARDAMGESGQVSLLTRMDGERPILEVTDTGMGMTAEQQKRIFEPFYTTKEFGKGSGLGLSTVYGIVQQHQAVIEVQSEPDQGTTFRISFQAGSP